MTWLRVSLVLVMLGAPAHEAHTYEPETHRELTQHAVSASSTNDILTSHLGLVAGTRAQFLGREARQLVGDGAASEDSPRTRAFNHFHNPLLSWEIAGLSVLFGLMRGESSALWQQNAFQDRHASGGNWSWQDARHSFLGALTASTAGERERAFADTFTALGHLTHLIQDASVPAHTRNDPHLFYEGYEAWVETVRGGRGPTPQVGQARRSLFLELLHSQPVRPLESLLTPTDNALAPVPVARLIDADVFDGLDPGALTGTAQGMAEYSNGNFVSDDTIFRDFAMPRSERLGTGFLVSEGRGQRLYFPRESDGEVVPHFVAEGTWFERLRFRGRSERSDMLTDRVYQDYACLLIPRAVGYSAAMLDYFFRGRLDVDLVPDGEDFDTVRVSGLNGSPEALAGGTLTLHADDASGRRSSALPLDADLTITAAPGASLTSARFRLPPDTERSMAVYQGRLGDEAPAPSFAGTVIGRALGGVRVEEVFLDFASDPSPTWKLRTPKGLFLLKDADRESPLTWHDFDDVRWGDGDDQLVGRTRFGAGRPNRVTAYTLPRLAGTIEVVTANTPDGPAVNLVRLADWVLPPGGIALGTTLSLNYTIDFRQQLVAYERTSLFRWTVPFPGVPGSYVAAPEETTSPTVRTVAGLTVPFADTFGIVLDSIHYDLRQSPTDGATYSWTLSDVSATAAGRLVGLIRVDHAPPPFFRWPRVNQPVYGLDPNGALIVLQTCSSLSCFPLTVSVTREFPVGLLLWAVVELETGRVLARTADDRVTIAAHAAVEAPNWLEPGQSPRPIIYRHNFERYEGGQDDPRTIDLGWSGEGVRAWDGQVFSTLTPLALHPGSGQTTSGMFRAELAGALGIFLQLRPGQPAFTRTHTFGDSGRDQKLLEVSVPATGPVAVPIFLGHALRARPAPGMERLVLTAEGLMPEQRTMDAVLVWDPATARAAALHASPIGPEGERLSLSSATTSAALVPALGEGGGYVVSLDGVGPPRFLPDPADALSSYRLLAPQALYNVLTERFHRIVATPDGTLLQITAVPLVLKDGPGGPIGDYHAIRLP